MTARTKHLLLILACALPIVIFYRVVFSMSVNVPFQDDFDGLLEPVLQLYGRQTSFSEFWRILYTQDDERRIVVDRLIAFLICQVSGQLSLRAMMIGGALNLLVLTGVLYQWFRSTRTSWLLFLPIPWLLFNIQYYEAVFWAMIPFQHLAVFVWAILALWLLSRDGRKSLVLGILAAILSIYADVSGNFILPAGALVLAARQRWADAGWWLGIVGLVVVCYFTGLVIPEYRPKLSDNFSDPLLLLKILTALFGSWADPGPTFPLRLREILAVVFGIAGLAFVLFLLIKRLRQLLRDKKPVAANEAFLWGALCFIAIVLAVLASGRASEGLESVFKPRYRHMYVLWLIFIYLLALRYCPRWLSGRWARTGLIAAAVLFCANAYVMYWGGLDRYRKTFLSDGYQWYHNRALPSSPIYLFLRDRVDEIYEAAYEKGIYRPEEYPFAALPQAPVAGETEINLAEYDGGVDVEVVNFNRKGGKNDGAYVIFRAADGEETHILPAYHTQRPLHRLLTGGSYYYPGARIDRYATAYFRSGVYDVEVGVIEGGRQYRLVTGKQLRL